MYLIINVTHLYHFITKLDSPKFATVLRLSLVHSKYVVYFVGYFELEFVPKRREAAFELKLGFHKIVQDIDNPKLPNFGRGALHGGISV